MCLFTIQAPAESMTLLDTAKWIINDAPDRLQGMIDGEMYNYELPEEIDGVRIKGCEITAMATDRNTSFLTGAENGRCSCYSNAVVDNMELAHTDRSYREVYERIENLIVRERHHRTPGHIH
ncbi:hypothetical protein ACTXIU_13065 [Glutamicibacter arilaitensis]|uniref:hypothetical protein n=1 Tax=Glutamicibacter arilaitensis TaxID=256701 RepID=UPI003FD1E3EA